MNASEVAIGVPLIAVTVSPGWSPARAAGDPGVTGWGQFCDAVVALGGPLSMTLATRRRRVSDRARPASA